MPGDDSRRHPGASGPAKFQKNFVGDFGRDPVLRNAKLASFGNITQVGFADWIPPCGGMTNQKRKEREKEMRKFLCLVLGIIGLFIMPAMADNPCRNLFDGGLEYGAIDAAGGDHDPDVEQSRVRNKQFIELSAGTYTISCNSDYEMYIVIDGDERNWNKTLTFTLAENGTVRFMLRNATDWSAIINLEDPFNIQLTQASCYDIKIASTKYVETQFSDLDTALANAIATVNTVVSNTITQASTIGTLQSTKQTRPDETCPAGKKCLLVEDTAGVPHWYEICSSAHCLPDGYTELQYIESTGTQYIDTGVYATNNTAIETKFVNNYAESSTRVLIADRWASSRQFVLSIVAQTNAPLVLGGLNKTLNSYWSINTDFTVLMDKNNIIVNGDTIAWTGSETTFTSTMPLYMFGVPDTNNRNALVNMYYMKIYENGTLVRNFIPATNVSNVVGMYDTVSNTFFTNSGTGSFTAGPVGQ